MQVLRSSKLDQNWEGPYQVLKRLDDGQKKVVVHFDHMKSYAERVPKSKRVQQGRKRQPPPRLKDVVLTRTQPEDTSLQRKGGWCTKVPFVVMTRTSDKNRISADT
ncbi:hypothetical protein T05_7502 [Trichinella murrelli]|uniref:Retrovirus-related Pol polyprotein from transposon n=1 Tax=Trichinella murrelli TaxID=144512 RepID=A0A0V0TEG5_9BILA|nr:hypothetical protein T05_7502 [Trichinella murrelli]